MARVASEAQYERSLRKVRIGIDEPGAEIKLTPYKNAGRRLGFTEMLDQVIVLDARSDDSQLGLQIRRALDIATAGP